MLDITVIFSSGTPSRRNSVMVSAVGVASCSNPSNCTCAISASWYSVKRALMGYLALHTAIFAHQFMLDRVLIGLGSSRNQRPADPPQPLQHLSFVDLPDRDEWENAGE